MDVRAATRIIAATLAACVALAFLAGVVFYALARWLV
jgi:hypothetical protein